MPLALQPRVEHQRRVGPQVVPGLPAAARAHAVRGPTAPESRDREQPRVSPRRHSWNSEQGTLTNESVAESTSLHITHTHEPAPTYTDRACRSRQTPLWEEEGVPRGCATGVTTCDNPVHPVPAHHGQGVRESAAVHPSLNRRDTTRGSRGESHLAGAVCRSDTTGLCANVAMCSFTSGVHQRDMRNLATEAHNRFIMVRPPPAQDEPASPQCYVSTRADHAVACCTRDTRSMPRWACFNGCAVMLGEVAHSPTRLQGPVCRAQAPQHWRAGESRNERRLNVCCGLQSEVEATLQRINSHKVCLHHLLPTRARPA